MANAVPICLWLLFSGLSCVTEAASPDTEHASCQVWDGIANQLTTNTGAQQKCWSNGTNPCTRIDCSGAYEYNSKNTFGFNLGKSIEVDYCFGIILNHCDRNISLDFYLQVPAKRVDKTTRVFHNTLLSIPGLSYSISGGTSAQGYLYFEMRRDGTSDNSYVTFSVTVKVRVSFAGFNTWPSTLQRRLISNETVPVPPCAAGARNLTSDEPPIGQCHPPHWRDSPSPSPAALPSYTGDLDKRCAEADGCSNDPWLVCNLSTGLCDCNPDFEKVVDKKTKSRMCQPRIRHGLPCVSDGDCSIPMSERCLEGRCQCQEGDKFNPVMQTCEASWKAPETAPSMPTTRTPATPRPHSAAQPASGPSKKSGQNKTAVIAGAVVGGLVVLAGILLAAYFAIRRLRRPYHNRELLLEGDDGDGIM